MTYGDAHWADQGCTAVGKGTAPFFQAQGKKKSQPSALRAGSECCDNTEKGHLRDLRVESGQGRPPGGGQLSLEDQVEICHMF